MGLIDTIIIPCPCGGQAKAVTKAGPGDCDEKILWSGEVTLAILDDLTQGTHRCTSCRRQLEVRVQRIIQVFPIQGTEDREP